MPEHSTHFSVTNINAVSDIYVCRFHLKLCVALKRAVLIVNVFVDNFSCLTSESVQSAALTFQRIDNVHGRNSLSLGVLGVGDGVTDDVLKEHLQDTTGLFVDQTRDTFHTSSTGQSADCRLGNALDVVTQNFAMTLGSTFAQTFASLASS
jgi:hypothetical protein